jgi:hypothetical protein
MSYSERASRAHPVCVLFVIDQSGSMDEPLEGEKKADFVARALNRSLQELVLQCSKDEGVRDYFHVGVLGYYNGSAENALVGELKVNLLNPISMLEQQPHHVEDVERKVPDGAGGLITMQAKFPVWYMPRHEGGTPMSMALTVAAEALADWCDGHPESFPPVVIHLTDGMWTDKDPESVASAIRQLSTNDGEVLLMNIHIAQGGIPIAFPDDISKVRNEQYAQLLYRMSSVLPQKMIETATRLGYRNLTDQSRGYIFEGKTEDIVQFFEIGTSPVELR